MSTSAPLLHSAPARTGGLPPLPSAASPAWREELNARLREHRECRNVAAAPSGTQQTPASERSAASHVAERVAARYSNAPSYQDLLAASAAAAASAAEAALEAHAAAQAMLTGWEDAQAEACAATDAGQDPFADPFFTERCFAEPAHVDPRPQLVAESPAALSRVEEARSRSETLPLFAEPLAHAPHAMPLPLFTAVAQEPLRRVEHPTPLPQRQAVPARTPVAVRARALVDAFAEAMVPAAQSLPAKLIEFPRELIAPRRQRPRLAEGPLYEESSDGHLRIFEVGAEAQSPRDAACTGLEEQESMPIREQSERDEPLPRRRAGFHLGAESRQAPPRSGWGNIQLGEHPQPEPEAAAQAEARSARIGERAEAATLFEDQARVTDRCMAALVDFGLVFFCFLLSVMVFASCTVHLPVGKTALAGAVFALGVMAAFYGWLFMTFGGGSTPGMRYARIALCTFGDENPSRKELQNRLPATALALLPLGLGVLWALLDEDKLGWHDRMTRTYQRSYGSYRS